MKKILLTLGIGIVMLVAGQSEKPMTPEQKALKNTMQTMSEGLMRIQKAILYNNKEELLAGVRMLKTVQPGFLTQHGKALENYMPNNPKFAVSLAKKSEQNIERYVRMMRSDIFSKHDYSKISAAYTHIMQECVGCHQKLRQWKWER
jgi:cytochrome c556